MSRRVLIGVGTAVILVLAAACGFLLGNSVRENTPDTENGQSAYVGSEMEETDSAADNQEEAAQTTSDQTASQEDSDTAQAASGESTAHSEPDGSSSANTGDVSTNDTDGIAASGEGAASTESIESIESAAGVTSDDAAASGEYEYIVFSQDGTLVIYYSDAATVYFDSGIEVEHLPEETRTQAEQGITFQSEEELFGFLESYSS